MVIRWKDAVKLLGILIMAACAVWPCTMFLNSNIDLAKIKDQITSPEIMEFYDAAILSGKVVIAVSGGVLLLTTVVMLFFYIKHYIDTHKAELGILKALGYSNWKIASGFWVFGLSVFVGTSIGFGAAWIMMPAFYKEMRSDEILPDVTMHFNFELIIYFILLPAIAFALLSMLYAFRKLNHPALELIRGRGSKIKVKKQKSEDKKEHSFLQDLRKNTVRSRFSLVFLIFFASFCYANAQMAFSMNDLSSEMMGSMMLGIMFVLAFTTLFIAVTTVVKANAKTVAMLRVFGYFDHECGRAILSGYRPAAYIGFALGSIYQYGLMKIMISMYTKQSAFEMLEYNFDVPVCIITFISFVIIYELIMLVYTVRMKRTPLGEVMGEE